MIDDVVAAEADAVLDSLDNLCELLADYPPAARAATWHLVICVAQDHARVASDGR